MIWPFHGWTSPAPALVLPDTSLSENNSADACVQALVDYVNVLREDGLFVEHEIHPEVFDLYRADHYHSQVCNGGHSQFLYNVPSHQKTLEGAIRAFRKTGAEEFAATAADLLKWVRSNPGLAAEQDGFRSRHPDLKLLDAHFFEVNKRVDHYELVRRHVRGRRDLIVLPSDQYSAAMAKILRRNRFVEARKALSRMNKLTLMCRDRLRGGIQLSATLSDEKLQVRELVNGRPTTFNLNSGDEQGTSWLVATNQGGRWGGVHSEGAFIALNDNGRVGEVIETASRALVDAVVEEAKAYEVGVIASELFRIAGLKEQIETIACVVPPDTWAEQRGRGIYFAWSDKAMRVLQIGPRESILSAFDDGAVLARFFTMSTASVSARMAREAGLRS